MFAMDIKKLNEELEKFLEDTQILAQGIFNIRHQKNKDKSVTYTVTSDLDDNKFEHTSSTFVDPAWLISEFIESYITKGEKFEFEWKPLSEENKFEVTVYNK